MQPLRETFAQAAPYRDAIRDRDSIFNADVIAFLKATGLEPKRTSIQAPWHGIAERWIGSCRREILDHIIPVNEEQAFQEVREGSVANSGAKEARHEPFLLPIGVQAAITRCHT
jgi:hypothetical protein